MTTPTSGQAPHASTIDANLSAVAAGSDLQTVVGEAPEAGTIARVAYIPVSTVTGANTNSRTLTVTNRKQDGTGTTVAATLALTSGVNAAADDEKAVTLSGTAANLAVAAGDVITFESTHVGTGIADPGGRVVIELDRS